MKPFLSDTTSSRQAITAAVFLSMIALVVYGNTFHAPFVYDDVIRITENPFIRITEITQESLIRIFKSPGFRPSADFSFAINYFFHGYDVRGYRMVNLIIHIITSLLVFLVIRQTLRLCEWENRSANWPVSISAAALWLVNPLHTQSVTYIVQRMNSLATMFFLLALLCYIRVRINASSEKGLLLSIILYICCLGAAFLGLLSKETAAVLPLVLLLYEWFFFQDLNRAWLKRLLPWMGIFFLVMPVLAIIYLGGDPFEKLAWMYEKLGFSLGERLLTEIGVVIYYLSLLFFPHPDRLNLIYDFPLSNTLTDPPATLVAFAALLTLLFAAIYTAKRHRIYSFAVFWFLLTLVIESSFIGLELIYEHRTYLPSVFPIAGLSVLTLRSVRPRPLAVIVLCLAIGISSLWTYQRNRVWQNELDLWRDNVAKAPLKANAYVKLGSALMNTGQDAEAEKYCREALYIDPGNAGAYNLLGLMLLRQGQPEKALTCLQQAVRAEPDDLQYYHNLGVALAESGQTEKAIAVFEKVIDLVPHSSDTLYALARIMARQNDLDRAVDLFQKAIIYQPGHVMAYNDLGLVLLMRHNIHKAVVMFEKAVALDPDYAGAHLNLAQVLKRKAPQKALNHASRASMLTPEDPRPHILAGEILTALGKVDEAIDAYREAVVLRPDNPRLLYRMACLYGRQKDTGKALAYLKKAVGNGYNNREQIRNDKDLEDIRQTDYYRHLVSDQAQVDGCPGKKENMKHDDKETITCP